MRKHRRPFVRHAHPALALPGAILLAGCNAEPEPEPPEFVADHTYTDIPGTVAVVPNPARPIDGFAIRHGHLPEFRGKDGEIHVNADGTLGMKAMTMDFNHLAPGVSIDQFEVGDAVIFGFEVDWSSPIRYRIHEIQLDLDPERASPPSDAGDAPVDG